MNKIPVFATVSHAYGFAVSQFFRVLGVVWAPLAVMIALSLMLTPGFPFNHMPTNDPAEVSRETLQLLPGLFVLGMFVRAMISVGVTELALGKRTGTTLVYFSLGSAVWRMLAAWILFTLVMFAIYFALIIFVVVVGVAGGFAIKSIALSQGSSTVAVGLLVIGCGLLFIGALIYVMARLTFFIPPVVVSEEKVDLARGWQLTKGNFWRIFWIGFFLFIPLIAVGVAIFFLVFGTEILQQWTQIFTLAAHSAKQEVIQHNADAMAAGMRARTLALWPYTSVANILLGAFSYGLLYSASVFGYRAVTQTSAPMLHPAPAEPPSAGHG